MKLSILICTIPKRQYFFDRIMSIIEPQCTDEVETLSDDDPVITIGEKRNRLMSRANGDYIVFVDDDDFVPGYYVSETLKALETNPDCTGFKGIITVNSQFPKIFIHSNKYDRWYQDEKFYYRTPNHWNAVKKELAIQAGFPDINWGEDHKYSLALKPLLKTEVFIDKVMYYYLSSTELSEASKRKKEDKRI